MEALRLILKNAKEDAHQLQSIFPYILSEKILRKENTLLARILQQHTLLNCVKTIFCLLFTGEGKWGKYALRSANKIKRRKISLIILAIKLKKPENQHNKHLIDDTQVLLKICNLILSPSKPF